MNPKNIILISDPRVLAVPIHEGGNEMFDLRNSEELKVDDRKKQDSDFYFLVRSVVAQKLVEAKKLLPKDIAFLIIEGYRPLSLQKKYFDAYSQELKTSHQDWDEKHIYEEASKFVAPPDIIPPHSTGGAIDLTLVDSNGKELDMGTPVNADPEESKNKCFMQSEDISTQAKQNRKILADALLKLGFINYPTEWWHWSYGDRYWAYCTNQDGALFGLQ
ncbi:MAG TPA: M15 family metallopeptidase [Candidatus Paceibacterota bacterium]|nr:M15 family metallopeptidase [Candidatus Paceibacterota bacterium]